jgi:hypothetical protein
VDDNFSGNIDLFGDPIPANRFKRGRPAHAWTLENSNKINLLFATGSDLKEAAAVLEISAPTFRKHYFSEIARFDAARLRLKAKLLAGLADEAGAGNVAAIKELFRQVDLGRLVNLADHVANRSAKKPAPKLGKKESLEGAAREITGLYEAPAAPRLIN